MSAFERHTSAFSGSALLLSGIIAALVNSSSLTASDEDSPVIGSSVFSATSVHDDKHVTKAVLSHSVSESRPQGSNERTWTSAHGKKTSRSSSVVNLQPVETGTGSSVSGSRETRPTAAARPHPIFMASAGRPAIPPVPDPVRENTSPEDLELQAIELSPVETSSMSDSRPSTIEPVTPTQPVLISPSSESVSRSDALSEPPAKADAANSLPKGITERVALSASQRLKLALEEEGRRKLHTEDQRMEQPRLFPSLSGEAILLDPVEEVTDEMAAKSPAAEPNTKEHSFNTTEESENAFLDERSRRFARLKEQLMQLRTQLDKPADVDAAEQPPLNSEDLHPEHQDQGPVHKPLSHDDGHAEQMLPPVEDKQDHGAEEAAEELQAPDEWHSNAVSPEHSVHAESSPAEDEHTKPSRSPDNGEHEPAGEGHADSQGSEMSAQDKGHHSGDSHAPSVAAEHSVDGGAELSLPGHSIVEGTIDRLGLANNLYAVGEYELALNLYEQTDSQKLTDQQQIWSDYQMANCMRRMGRHAEASIRYRRIAEQPEAGWLSDQSRWWVDVLEQIRQLQASLEEDEGEPEETPQSPFAGIPRDGRSTKSQSGQTAAPKSRASGSGHADHSAGNNGKGTSSAGSKKGTPARSSKPPKERITHFAPSTEEPKHGED